MKNAIYFEFPSEYNDIFEQLSQKLFSIDIQHGNNDFDRIRPFQEMFFMYDNKENITRLKITLSPDIFNYLIKDEDKQKEIDEISR